MRPRADYLPDLGNDDDFVKGQFTDPLVHDTSAVTVQDVDSDEEPDQAPQREDASVILRRGITFGPELGPDETEKTTKSRGVYFTCYQSDIRDGFNFLMTRKLHLNYGRRVFLTVMKAGQATVFSHHPSTRPTSMVLEWIHSSTRDSVMITLKVISVCITVRIRRRRTGSGLEKMPGWISVEANISSLHPFEACGGSAMHRRISRRVVLFIILAYTGSALRLLPEEAWIPWLYVV
jgi:hypothetical protein